MANQRLNKYLGRYLSDAPQSFIYKMLRKKNITLNNNKAIGTEILQQSDVVKLFISDETIRKFQRQVNNNFKNIPVNLNIAYEDENILVVIKPKGQLSHPNINVSSLNDNKDSSLIYNILSYLKHKGEYNSQLFTPALANRLDRNTTGLIICGKNLGALQCLNKMIREKQVDKHYLAIVLGKIEKKGTIKSYFKKDSEKNTVKILHEKPQLENGVSEVITNYEPIKTYKNLDSEFTYIKLHLVTGKTHQLRAHMAYINHPILGDPKYGSDKHNKWAKNKFKINSQLLHATSIYFKEVFPPLSYLKGKKIISQPTTFTEVQQYFKNKG